MHLLLSEPREGDRLAARVLLFGMPPRNELMRGDFFCRDFEHTGSDQAAR